MKQFGPLLLVLLLADTSGAGKIEPVLSIYSADLDLESTRDARIDLRRGAMVEAQHPTEGPLPEDEAHIHAFPVFEPDLETQRCANCNDRVVTAR